MKNFETLSMCLCCGSQGLELVLDLREQPLANSYHDSTKPLPIFPLGINRCTQCFHCQQLVAVDPDLMFKQYAYVSGTTKTINDYFDWLAQWVDETVTSNNGPKKLLDIACNDGSELVPFLKRGWKATGVDPAENLLERSRATGATVLCDYWNVEVAGKLTEKFDAIVAQNVFAHNADPLGFLNACTKVMHNASKIFIQTSQANMFVHGEFDTIYHEHISFFSLRSMETLAKRAGLVIEDVHITPVHGESYVFVLGYGARGSRIEERLHVETVNGVYTETLYTQFAMRAKKIVADIKHQLAEYEKAERRIVGFGAAAKGNTFLNFANIVLEYIVDENPLKQGLYTPGMNILIQEPAVLRQEAQDVVIVTLAWNFFDEIYRKAKALRPDKKDTFVTYFPEVKTRE